MRRGEKERNMRGKIPAVIIMIVIILKIRETDVSVELSKPCEVWDREVQ